jgi:hypothetical protein
VREPTLRLSSVLFSFARARVCVWVSNAILSRKALASCITVLLVAGFVKNETQANSDSFLYFCNCYILYTSESSKVFLVW